MSDPMTADRAALRHRVSDTISMIDEGEALFAVTDKVIALIRAEVLEEAARVADAERWNTACLTSLPPQSSAAFNIAAAIRALKGDNNG